MHMQDLKDLYVHKLQDLYSAEKQAQAAYQKIEKGLHSDELKAAIAEHLQAARDNQERIRRLFDDLEGGPEGVTCEGMQGLLKEATGMLKEDASDEVKDAGSIAMVQSADHYFIAGYGTVRTYAGLLGLGEHRRELEAMLEAARQADLKLTDIAERLNVEAKEA